MSNFMSVIALLSDHGFSITTLQLPHSFFLDKQTTISLKYDKIPIRFTMVIYYTVYNDKWASQLVYRLTYLAVDFLWSYN